VNRWSFLTIIVLAASAVAAFGIWTWGRQNSDSSSDRARAEADLRAIVKLCEPDCQPIRVWHIGGDDWGGQYRSKGQTRCALIQLERFTPRGTEDFNGAAPMACPAE
jgi:hypothetical protein